jgi:hypothetical protein
MKVNRNRWLRLALLTVAAIALFAPAAVAADRVSGIITKTFVLVDNTDLVGDVTCDVGSAACFSFNVPDIELRLNGFTISGMADPVIGCGGAAFSAEVGITTNRSNNVSVRGPGLVQRFRGHGVSVAGSTNARVLNILTSTNCLSGIFVAATSFGTLVESNVAVRNGSSAPGLSCGGI